MAKTQRERIIFVLDHAGWRRDPQPRSLRFAVFFKPGQENKFYVGKAGALRYGRTVAESHPAEKSKATILAKYEELTKGM